MTTPLLLLAALLTQPVAPANRAGQVYEITRVSDSVFSEDGEYGSSGSTHDRDTWRERVVQSREDGTELEFDLPAEATAEDRARVWQFPARVLRPAQGPLRLLNSPELEARLSRWLERAQWPRAMCGRWIFTWNAFKIECDPQAMLATLALVDLAATDPRDGASYSEPMGLASGNLRREVGGAAGGAAFTVEVAIDPDKALRQELASAAVVTQIVGDNPGRRAREAERAARRITGTIRIRFETDAAGQVRRRVRVIEMITERVNGRRERRTTTETIERRLVSAPSS